MKVVIITNYWKISAGGGVKTYITNLVDAFDKMDDFEVSVLFEEGQDHENHKIEGNKVLFAIKSFLKLKEFRPEVIHSQGTWYCLLPGYVYKKLYGTRLIHTFHTQPTTKLSYIGTMFFQSLLNGCDCTTFVSKSLRKDNEAYGLKLKKTAITYAGVSSRTVSKEETNAFCDKFGIDDSNFVLLAQGFMSNEFKAKGAKILIKAVKCLSCHNPHIILILTGDGLYSNDVKKFVETERMSENVIFTEDLSNPYIPLKICNIYTHISLAEGGLSLSLLEAMSMGKPIIATNIGGIPEAIDNMVNGILVEPCEEQVTKKIEYLILNPNLARKLGNNAEQAVLNKFTWEQSADTFHDIFKSNADEEKSIA